MNVFTLYIDDKISNRKTNYYRVSQKFFIDKYLFPLILRCCGDGPEYKYDAFDLHCYLIRLDKSTDINQRRVFRFLTLILMIFHAPIIKSK